jgi:undecaprenyl-diphosphatase
MDLIILGILQGLTEFLPISSSGHLQLGQVLLNVREPSLLINVFLHGGTLLATVVVLRREILWLVIPRAGDRWGVETTRGFPSRGVTLLSLAVATATTAVLGLLLEGLVRSSMGDVVWLGPMWIFSGIALWSTRWSKRGSRPPTLLGALLVGLAQSMALFPGISRSGLTIAAGMHMGWGRRWSANFSFLISIPSIMGAISFEVATARSISREPWGDLLIACSLAFLVGWISLRWLLGIIQRGRLWLFAFYSWAMGLLVLIMRIGGLW